MSHPISNLGALADVITKGTTPSTLGFALCDDGVPLLRAQNLQDGSVNIDLDALYISVETHNALSRSKIFPGDVLISIAGTIGRAAYVDERWPELNCNQAVAIVRPKKQIYARYLLHWLNSTECRAQIARSQVTATISNLSLGEIAKLEVALPPLAEQRRIAAILDQADALRRKRREALEKLQTLKSVLFETMFLEPAGSRFPMGTIADLTASTQYGTSSKSGDEGRFPILRMGNITYDGELVLNDLKYIDFSRTEIAKYTVSDGDILFNRTNSPDLVGKTAVFRGAQVFAFAGYLVRLRTNERAVPEFISAYLNSRRGKTILRGMCKAIIGMANINAKELQTIPITLPPLDLQRAFAARVAEIDKLKAAHRAHLEKLDALFVVLQHRAFRGELTGASAAKNLEPAC